jgi:putative transposase
LAFDQDRVFTRLAARRASFFYRQINGERGIWQRRYWEHLIRDEADHVRHIDYIHINPVKHGLAPRAADWPHSSFHRFVQAGMLPGDWAGDAGVGWECGEPKLE